MATLTTIGGVASALGPAVEKASKVWWTNLSFIYLFIYFWFREMNSFMVLFIAGNSIGYSKMP